MNTRIHLSDQTITRLADQHGYEPTTSVTYAWLQTMTSVATEESYGTARIGRFDTVEEAKAFRNDPAYADMFISTSDDGKYQWNYVLTRETKVTASCKVEAVSGY